jgi:hypothetical protein
MKLKVQKEYKNTIENAKESRTLILRLEFGYKSLLKKNQAIFIRNIELGSYIANAFGSVVNVASSVHQHAGDRRTVLKFPVNFGIYLLTTT